MERDLLNVTLAAAQHEAGPQREERRSSRQATGDQLTVGVGLAGSSSRRQRVHRSLSRRHDHGRRYSWRYRLSRRHDDRRHNGRHNRCHNRRCHYRRYHNGGRLVRVPFVLLVPFVVLLVRLTLLVSLVLVGLFLVGLFLVSLVLVGLVLVGLVLVGLVLVGLVLVSLVLVSLGLLVRSCAVVRRRAAVRLCTRPSSVCGTTTGGRRPVRGRRASRRRRAGDTATSARPSAVLRTATLPVERRRVCPNDM